MIKTIRAPQFDQIIIVFIALNSVVMAMTDYRITCLERNEASPEFGMPDPNRCWQNTFGDFTNTWVFGPVFLVEAFCKVVALGFLTEGEGTYLKDNWNILDFVCVMSWVVAQAEVPGVSALQSLKMFRLLRPLKSLSKFQGLRRIVTTFMAAFDGLAVTVTLLTFLLLIVSIACMQFFKGALHFRCRLTPFPTRVPQTWYKPCVDYTWTDDGWPNGALPNCVHGNYFPTDDEFEDYRSLMLHLDYGVTTYGFDVVHANASVVPGLQALLDAGDDYGWQAWESEDTWACCCLDRL